MQGLGLSPTCPWLWGRALSGGIPRGFASGCGRWGDPEGTPKFSISPVTVGPMAEFPTMPRDTFPHRTTTPITARGRSARVRGGGEAEAGPPPSCRGPSAL